MKDTQNLNTNATMGLNYPKMRWAKLYYYPRTLAKSYHTLCKVFDDLCLVLLQGLSADVK